MASIIKERVKRACNKVSTWFLFLLTFGKKPVERDRWLFGRNGSGMVKFALCVAILVPTIIGSVALLVPDAENLLLGNYDTDVTELNGSLQGDSITLTANPDTHKHNTFWAVISQYTDPGNLPAAQKGMGYCIAIICAFAGIFCLSGFAVSSLISFINRLTERWKSGLLRYNEMFDNYVVVIGCNEQTANIIKLSLKRDDVKYVLIQTRQDVDKMRMKLDLDLDKEEEDRLVFYYAERTSREDIAALHLEKAKDVFILGEDVSFDNEEDHDVFNMCCLENISEEVKTLNIPNKLKVHVNLEYQSTFTAFKSTHIYKSLDKNVEFLPFNIHSIWAKKVLIDNFALVPIGKKGEIKVQNYLPIDSNNGIRPDDNKVVHLIIMGMNQMGTALGVQAALLAHFPNAHRNRNLRTTITFIDDQAVKEGEYFRGRFATMFDLCRYRTIEVGKDTFSKEWTDPMKDGRFKHLGENFMDIQWEFIQGNIASDEVRKYISDISENKNHEIKDSYKENVTTIAICFNHPQNAVAAALYLPEMVYRRAIQILVYQQNSFDLANKIASGEKIWKRYEKLRPFGMIEGSYTEDAFDNSMAKLLHFLYANGKIGNKNLTTDDYNFVAVQDISSYEKIDVGFVRKVNNLWNQLGIVDKLSNIDMVDSIPMKLRSLGVSRDDLGSFNEKLMEADTLELMAKAEHTRWLTERLTMGFRPLDDNDAEWRIFFKTSLTAEERTKAKNFKKAKSRAHLDICSNTMLKEVDPGVHHNDIYVLCHIPQLLNYREWMNFMRLADERTRSSFAGKKLQDFLIPSYGKKGLAAKLVNHNGDKFWLMEAVVTQKQWESIMGNNPSPIDFQSDSKPIVNVSKNDIDDFLKALRKMTGLHFDLPTYDEWSHAAHVSTNGISSKFFRVNQGNGDDKGPVDVLANIEEQSNDLHIYNMLGNVWEWTKTENKENEGCFYFCGGSWRFGKLQSDISNGKDYWYSFWKPVLKSDDIGFRLTWRFDVCHFADDEINDLVKQLSAISISSIPVSDEATIEDIEKLINMVDVETGYFVMGTENLQTHEKNSSYPATWIDENADPEETPNHFVKISKFKISDTPVTQALWNAVMHIEAKMNPSDNLGDDKPQTNISWREINEKFIPALNALTGRKFRLPTEAEWEYVAKEGHLSEINQALTPIFEDSTMSGEEKIRKAYEYLAHMNRYPRYSGTDDEKALDLYVRATTSGVKKRPENRLHVFDMSGNVWEWCKDFYQHDFYEECMNNETEYHYKEQGYVLNPECTNPMYSAHTFRGGSWRFDAKSCRNTSANYWIDTDTDDDLGFRLVEDV